MILDSSGKTYTRVKLFSRQKGLDAMQFAFGKVCALKQRRELTPSCRDCAPASLEVCAGSDIFNRSIHREGECFES
jgi:hypothetical protein